MGKLIAKEKLKRKRWYLVMHDKGVTAYHVRSGEEAIDLATKQFPGSSRYKAAQQPYRPRF